MTRDDGTRRTRAMVAACEGISTEALEAGVFNRLVDAASDASFELYQDAHSYGDPRNPANMESRAVAYRELKAVLALLKGEQQ